MIDIEVSQLATITKISIQKKAVDRYNIFLDDNYAFSVTEDILIKFNLRKGLTLTDEEIGMITESESWHRSYVQAIHFLSYRMRSKQEIRDYLKKKEVAPTVTEEIIARLEKEKHINDKEFAKAFIRDRMNQTSKGPRLIVKELKEKGVKAETANEAIALYSYERQFQTALKWAQKQLKRKSNQSYNKQNETLKIKLMQKGFTSDVVNEVFAEIKPPIDKEAELEALELQANKLYSRYEKKYQGNELMMKLKAGLYRRGFQGDLINEYVAKLDK